jgi:hypothetical protein
MDCSDVAADYTRREPPLQPSRARRFEMPLTRRLLPLLAALSAVTAFAADVPRPTLALQVRSSLKSAAGHIRQMAYDGKPEHWFASTEAPKAGDTFTLTFMQPETLNKVEITTGGPDGGKLAAGVLEFSADGATFADPVPFKDGAAAAAPAKAVGAIRLRATADGAEPLVVRQMTLDADPAIPLFTHPFEVHVICEVPEMADWCEKVATMQETWWSYLCERLPSEGFKPPLTLNLHYVKDMKGVAYTSGGGIYCADGWFGKHHNDIGACLHELTHWQQQYRGGGPRWFTEGVAEYMRYYCYEPPARPRKINPDRFDFKAAYGWDGSAALIDWLVRTKDKDALVKLNAVARTKWRDSVWQDLFGKTLDELGAEMKDELRKG